MSAAARARQSHAPPFIDPPGYSRHRPERTLLYQLVEQHYPAFRELRAAADRPLPDFVQQEFDAYLKCGRLEAGFFTCALRAMSCREARGVQLQEARVLSLLRPATHGRDRGAVGR